MKRVLSIIMALAVMASSFTGVNISKVSASSKTSTAEATKENNNADLGKLSKAATTTDAVTNGTCGDNLVWSLDGNVLTITGTGAMTDYSTSGCSSNPAPWSDVADTIESVQISDGVTTIGSVAFAGLTSLKAFDTGTGVTSIGEGSFAGCTSLVRVKISSKVTSIGKNAFNECTELSNIVYDTKVLESIGESAFEGCTAITSMTLPNSVTSLGSTAFKGCTGLKSIVLSTALTELSSCTFEGCTALSSIKITGKITTIGEKAFTGCTALKSAVIGNKVTTIGSNAFNECTSLTDVKIYNKKVEIASDSDTKAFPLGKTLTIESYSGSAAQTYATNNQNTFKELVDTDINTAKSSFSLSATSYEYTGAYHKPTVKCTRSLVEGSEYTVIYDYNAFVGSHSVTVSGCNGYKGSFTLTYKETPLSISKCSVKIPTSKVTYAGKPVTRVITVKYGKNILKANKDYKVTYKNNNKPGVCTVTVTPYGTTTGNSVKKTFIIKPAAVTVSSSARTSNTRAKLTWTKSRGATGYEIILKADGSKKKTVRCKRNSATLKVKYGTYYNVKIKAYKTIGGKKVYSQAAETYISSYY